MQNADPEGETSGKPGWLDRWRDRQQSAAGEHDSDLAPKIDELNVRVSEMMEKVKELECEDSRASGAESVQDAEAQQTEPTKEPSKEPNKEIGNVPGGDVAGESAEHEFEEFGEFELEEFAELSESDELNDVLAAGSAQGVVIGTAFGAGGCDISDEVYAESTAVLRAYLSDSEFDSASSTRDNNLERALEHSLRSSNAGEPPRPKVRPLPDRPQGKLSSEDLPSRKRAEPYPSGRKRPLDTLLNRVLRRSSEFAVGTIRLSVAERIACLVVVATSFSWFWIFIQHQVSLEAVPWCGILMFTAILSLSRYLSDRRINIFELLNVAGKSPITFGQSFAFSYLTFSAAIWICLWMSHGVLLQDKPISRRQVVDIELVSDKDFADHKEILPGSVEKPSLKSQRNDVEVTRRSPTPVTHRAPQNSSTTALMPSVNSVSAIRDAAKKVSPKETIKEIARERPRQTATRPNERYIINVADSPQVAHGAPAPNTSKGDSKSHSRQPVLEEVAPPEMVEITENQGDNGNEAFQPGGRSAGGTGRKTQLVSYLKELHRRIKHAWKPPGGETHSAEILFRIKKTGAVASIKLVTSSGDSDTDESAMHAIAACSPFKALPADYPEGYLDLLYTFNYNVDELSELEGHKWH